MGSPGSPQAPPLATGSPEDKQVPAAPLGARQDPLAVTSLLSRAHGDRAARVPSVVSVPPACRPEPTAVQAGVSPESTADWPCWEAGWSGARSRSPAHYRSSRSEGRVGAGPTRLLTGEWPAGPGPGSETSTRRVGQAVAHGSHSLRSRVWPESQNAAIYSRNESKKQSHEGSTETSRWRALPPAARPALAPPPGARSGWPHQLCGPQAVGSPASPTGRGRVRRLPPVPPASAWSGQGLSLWRKQVFAV